MQSFAYTAAYINLYGKLGLSVKALWANTERSEILVETKNQPFTKSKRIDSPIPQVIVVRSLLLKRDNERSKI